jgi:hypothetical protein
MTGRISCFNSVLSDILFPNHIIFGPGAIVLIKKECFQRAPTLFKELELGIHGRVFSLSRKYFLYLVYFIILFTRYLSAFKVKRIELARQSGSNYQATSTPSLIQSIYF